MTHNKIDRPNTAIESRSSLNGLIVSSLLALGVASAFTGHSLAATSPETNVARLERAMDKRPTPARSSDGLGLGRNVPQLRLEPIAISERDGAQNLKLSVISDRYDSPDQPATRYGISWLIRSGGGEVLFPDLPRLADMPADATQLRHELSIPLNLGPGYYELEVLIAVAGNDANGWTASSFLHFQLTDTELLLVSADEWLRDSRPSDPVGFADDGTAN